MKQACPCHSGQTYQTCCQSLHLGVAAPNAERLMRSRYSAYALKIPQYLKQTWHASTRPHDLSQTDLQGIKWLGLVIEDAQMQDNTHATVRFKARFKNGKDKIQTLHETSRFNLENKQWFYVDGEIH